MWNTDCRRTFSGLLQRLSMHFPWNRTDFWRPVLRMFCSNPDNPVLASRSWLVSNPSLSVPVLFGAGGIERSSRIKSGDHGGRDIEPALIMFKAIKIPWFWTIPFFRHYLNISKYTLRKVSNLWEIWNVLINHVHVLLRPVIRLLGYGVNMWDGWQGMWKET